MYSRERLVRFLISESSSESYSNGGEKVEKPIIYPKLVTISGLAQMLSCSRMAANEKANAGLIPWVQEPGSRIRKFRVSDVKRYINSLPVHTGRIEDNETV
jgi:hypothetical protein